MKKFRRLTAVFICIVCTMLAGCAAKSGSDSLATLSFEEEEELKNLAKEYVGVLGVMDITSYDQLIEQSQSSGAIALANGVQSLKDSREETGIYKSVLDTRVEEVDDGYRVIVNCQFEKRNVEIAMGLTKDLADFNEFTVTPEYTMGEKMKKAGLNLVVGMITVFAVLILLALIISCFKYIGKLEEKFTKKKAAGTEPKKAEAGVVEKTLNAGAAKANSATGEITPELIAVITAAIAASAGTDANGLVVRSIRRSPRR